MVYAVTENHVFTNREEFLQWKAKEERGTCTSYTKPKGGNSKGTGKYIVLYTFILVLTLILNCLLLFRTVHMLP